MEDVSNPSGQHGPKLRRHGQGSIFERADKPRLSRFAAVLSLGTDEATGRRRRRWYYGPTRKAVEKAMGKDRAAIAKARAAGASVASLDTTVGSWLATWLVEQRSRLRPGSWERYAGVAKLRIVPSLGSIAVYALTPDQVRIARARWGSPSMVAYTLRVLGAALADAVAEGLAERNVVRLVESPRLEHREQAVIGPAELRSIFAAFAGDWMYPLVVTAGLCGLRRGEALGLRRRDVDFAGETLTVDGQVRRMPQSYRAAGDSPYRLVAPKTASSKRTIGLPPTVAAALAAHIALVDAEREATKVHPKDDLVFATSDGSPINPNRVTKRFEVMLERSGIAPVRFHDLRHAAATILASAGVGTRTAMEILGHSSDTMTHHYTGVLASQKRDAAAAVELAIGGK